MYSKGEIVWSKIKGFPWWPAMIAKINESKDLNSSQSSITGFLVNFIGDNSHAQIGLDKVGKFWENYPMHGGNTKHKKLAESIAIAKSILKGETTYEYERDRLEQIQKNKKKKKEFFDEDSEEASDFESEIQSNLKKKLKLEPALKKSPSVPLLVKKQFPSQNSSTTITSIQDQAKLIKKKISPSNPENQEEKKKIAEPQVIRAISKENELISFTFENKETAADCNKDLKSSELIPRKKHPKILQIISDDEEDEKNYKFAKEIEKKEPLKKKIIGSFEVEELEGLFRKSLEKILVFSKANEGQETLIHEISGLLKDSSSLFDKIMKKSTEDDEIILQTLTNDIGKYMQMTLRLLEENNAFIKGIFLLDSMVKQMQEMLSKLKNKLFTKFFDFKSLIQTLPNNTSDSKILETVLRSPMFLEETSMEKNSSSHEKNIFQDDNNSRFEEFSLSSECFNKQKSEKVDEFELETMNSDQQLGLAKRLKNLKKPRALSETMQEVSNSKLRKKVCLKMYQVLSSSYPTLPKEKTHKIVLNLEVKLRARYPSMKTDYKTACINLMKLLKKKSIHESEISKMEAVGFNLDELRSYGMTGEESKDNN